MAHEVGNALEERHHAAARVVNDAKARIVGGGHDRRVERGDESIEDCR
jgi:hypothetical protein